MKNERDVHIKNICSISKLQRLKYITTKIWKRREKIRKSKNIIIIIECELDRLKNEKQPARSPSRAAR